MPAIATQELSKVYRTWIPPRKVTALDALTLAVDENRIFGFLGPNGAGKTTTIKLLLGLIQPTDGDGTVLMAPLGDRDAKGRIGFLPDSPQFYSHLSAKNFLFYCAKLLHLPYEQSSAKIPNLLERMNLGDAQNQKLSEFSRGMLQRLGIAQALLNDPELVVLDEPLTGLDPKGRVEIKNIMHELKKEGKTVFFSSHILADVEEMCDDIGILNRGRLISAGAVKELLAEKEVTVWVDKFPKAELGATEEYTESLTMKKNQCGFTLKSRDVLDEFRSVVEKLGGEVINVEGQKESLESYFLKVVEEDDTKRQQEGSGK